MCHMFMAVCALELGRCYQWQFALVEAGCWLPQQGAVARCMGLRHSRSNRQGGDPFRSVARCFAEEQRGKIHHNRYSWVLVPLQGAAVTVDVSGVLMAVEPGRWCRCRMLLQIP